MKIDLTITHENTILYPAVQEGVNLEWSRKGTPGKLKFTVVKDKLLNFEEGDAVKLTVDEVPMFFGFVFTKSRASSSPELIEVTCYDQLRYLKNKDTYNYQGKTTGELLRMIAEDYRLNVGSLSDTGYPLTRCDSDTALFDVIQNSIDNTLMGTGKLYILYDDVGALTLQNAEDMRTKLLISVDTMGSYSYSSTIDSQTYNQIKVVLDDSESGVKKVYMAKDSANINKWGVLQYNDTVKTEANGAAKANALLSLYNQKTRTLSISDALGNTGIRAGSSVIVSLDLGDVSLLNYMMAESVTHKFSENQHLMDLKLRGGSFVT